MSEVQDSWKEVSSKAEALGLKLKLHLEQEASEDADREPGDTKAMVDELGKKVQDAFESMGKAAKDPAVHEDVKDMGRLIKDALVATVSAVGDEVSSRTGQKSSDAEGDSEPVPPAELDPGSSGDEDGAEGGDD